MKLKAKQQSQLADLTEIVTRNLEIFRAYGVKLHETGQALAKIKAILGPEFNAYCSQTWGFTKDQANRLIHGAKTVAALPIGSAKPKNESQTRALRHIPDELRGEAMDAVSADGKPTAAKLDELAKAVLASEDPAAAIRAAREKAVQTAGRQSGERAASKEQKAVDALRRKVEKARVEVPRLVAAIGPAEKGCVGIIDVDQAQPIREEMEMLGRRVGDLAGRYLKVIEGTAALGKAA